MIINHLRLHALALTLLVSIPFAAFADGLDGNRYNLERIYNGEISAASAYLKSTAGEAVIIDVRTIEEHKGGHPEGSYNIPFPHVYNRQRSAAKGDYIGQTPEDFVAAVEAAIPDKSTVIITMCRTGYRSVLAGNLLKDAGYENVYNMWQGFKGNLKYNETSEVAAKLDDSKKKPKALIDNGSKVLVRILGEALDLDGDGEVSTDAYSGDLDGWANYQGLPVSFDLSDVSKRYQPYISWYDDPAIVGER